MINPNDWKPQELEIFKTFGYKCLSCRVHDAVTLHELVPKSKAPFTWNRPENRVPLCAACHNQAHQAGTTVSREILTKKREEYLNE